MSSQAKVIWKGVNGDVRAILKKTSYGWVMELPNGKILPYEAVKGSKSLRRDE